MSFHKSNINLMKVADYNFIDDNTLEISFTLVDDMSIKTNCVLHANTKRPKYIINSNNT
jgi:hypothetical protein